MHESIDLHIVPRRSSVEGEEGGRIRDSDERGFIRFVTVIDIYIIMYRKYYFCTRRSRENRM